MWFGIALIGLAFLVQGCATTPAVDTGVYVLDAVSGDVARIGESGGAPVWAPAGDAIVWATEDGLLRRNLLDGESTRLTESAIAGRPAWSPDGSAIAIIDIEEEALVVLDARSGETQFSVGVATKDADHPPLALPVLGGPAWSPDGTLLAFNCWDGHGDEICVVRANGSEYQQVSHIRSREPASEPPSGTLVLAASNAGPPAWSPDGMALALAVYPEQRGAPAGVFVVDLQAGTARRVSSLLPNSEISWFADGESLLFSASERGRSDALKTSITGSDAVNLTAGLAAGAREPTLSTDGQHLAVVTGGAIVLLDSAGNVERATDMGHSHRFPAWSSRGDVLAYTTAPDLLINYS